MSTIPPRSTTPVSAVDAECAPSNLTRVIEGILYDGARRGPEIGDAGAEVQEVIRGVPGDERGVGEQAAARGDLVDPTLSDLVGGSRRLYYSYEDPVSDLRGRGFLGFGAFHVWDPQRPMETITTFDQRTATEGIFPGAFRPRSVTTVVPIMTQDEVDSSLNFVRARVTESAYWYELRSLNSGISHAVFPYSSTTKEWEQPVTIDWNTSSSGAHVLGVIENNPAPLREVARASEIDDYGNPTQTWRWTQGGVTEAVGNTYDYRPISWLMGLPQEHCVKKIEEATPGQPEVTRCETYTHDWIGRLATLSIEEGNLDSDIPQTTTFAYDGLGLSTSITFEAADVSPLTAHTEYAPMFPGQPDERVFPSQVWADHDVVAFRPSTWLISHPAYGVPVAMMDANGVQTQIQYDDLGRPVSMHHDGDESVTVSYSGRPDLNPNGGLNGTITQIQKGFQTSKVVADALGRTLRGSRTVFDGSIADTFLTYDILGRMVHSAEPVKPQVTRITKNTYDSLNRLLESQLPDGNKLVTKYPSMFVTQSFDASSNETDVTRDLDGRVVTSVNILDTPVPGTHVTTTYGYAPFDQVDRVTDDLGHVTTMHYDVRGRQIQLDDPDQGTTTFDYNGFGNLYKSTHVASGQTKKYAHDDLGRLLATLDNDGLTTFVWDASPFGIGKLASTLSPDSIATEARYDNRGRLVGEDLIDDQNVKYSIDMGYVPGSGPLSGKPWTLAYPEVPGRARFAVSNSYNNAGYIHQIFGNVTPWQAPSSLWEVKTRNRDMALLLGTLGNLTDVTRGYDDLTGRMTSLNAMGAPPIVTPVVEMGYDYHPNALLKTRKDLASNRGETFEYDSLLRLKKWSLKSDKAALLTQYTYDSIGNLLEVDENQQPIEVNHYGVNGAQPHTLTGHFHVPSGLDDTYTYDTLGRQTSGGGRTIPSYSASDLPRTVTRNGATWILLYDAFGRRVKKIGTDGTTLYVGGLYERRQTSAGVQHVFHVDGTDGPVADVIYDGAVTRPSYIVSDPLGSTAVVLDAVGAVTDRFFHQPFGKRIDADGQAFSGAIGPMKNGFTGQESDDTFGLINFQGRMYDPELKRFMSADPLVTFPGFGQSWNPYSYVLNSPLNFTDPSGFAPNEVCTSLGVCYPAGGGVDGGSVKDLSAQGSGPFGGRATGVTGDTTRGGCDGVAKSDGSGSRQVAAAAAAATLTLGAGVGTAAPAATLTGAGASTVGLILASVAAFLGITLWSSTTIVNQADEDAMLAASKAAAALRGAAKAIPKVIPKTTTKDEGSTTFYHGGTLAEVTAIVATKIVSPVSVNTHKYERGSFFTHESSQPLALIAASLWPVVSGKINEAGVGVVAMTVPNNILRELRAARLVQTGFVPTRGIMPPETVFAPASFPVLALRATFRLVTPEF